MKSINPAWISCPATVVTLCMVLSSPADERHVNAGIAAYHNGNYKSAVESFVNAIQAAPQDSSLHYWLGKCYGRIAARSNWFAAMSYAKKTLKQFRKAVELDANNYDALRDLINFLDTAPGFLGGNKQEAKHLGQQLEKLQSVRTGSNE